MQKLTIGSRVIGPSKQQIETYPDPDVGWISHMSWAVGIEGVVCKMDGKDITQVHFPSLQQRWWYTSGALTKGEDQPYHFISVEDKPFWITTTALTNLKNELGIIGDFND